MHFRFANSAALARAATSFLLGVFSVSALAQLAPGTTIRVLPPDGLVIDAGGQINGGTIEVRDPQGQPLANVSLTRTRIDSAGATQGTAGGLLTNASGIFAQGVLAWGNDVASLRGGANRYCLVNVPATEAALACVDVTVLGTVITSIRGRKFYSVGSGTPLSQTASANTVAAAAAVRVQLNNVQSRLRTLRQGVNVGWVNDTTVQINGRTVPLSSAPAQTGGSQQGSSQGSDSSRGETPEAARTGGWGAYVMGTVAAQEMKGSNAFKVGTNGLSFGGDYRFNRRFVIGAAAGYSRSSSDLSELNDAQTTTGSNVTLYSSFEPAPRWYVDAAVSVARNSFDLKRRVASDSLASATSKGRGVGYSLTSGYQFFRSSFIMSPYLRVDSLRVTVDGYTETGESPYRVSEQALKSTSVTLGGDAQLVIPTARAILIPYTRLELQRQTQDNASSVNAQLIGSSAQLQIDPSTDTDQTYGTFSLGLSAQFKRGLTAFADFETLFGKSDTSEQRFNVGLKLEF